MTGTPCDLRDLSGSTTAQANLIFNYCNPVIANVRMANLNITVPNADACNDEPQELLIYGVDLGGNTGNIRFSSELSPGGTVILPDLYVSCAFHILRLAQGNIQSYQWSRNGVNIPAAQGGTQRNLWIDQPGTYRLNADYGSACVASFQQTVDFSGIYREWLGLSNDWNDHNNWTPASVPDSCAYVIIPGGLPYYPIIVPGDYVTDPNNPVPTAVCNIIEFQFGGEAKNTHFLTYKTEARVEMQLNSNQWYMISAPLRNTYSGDFYIDNPNPIFDLSGRGMAVYTQQFHITNPQQGTFVEHNWTGAFNTPDIELLPGQGIALFANPRNSAFNQQDQLQGTPFWFPKLDTIHYYYNFAGQVVDQTDSLDLSNYGRFIYESVIDPNGLVPLAHSPLAPNMHTLAGNPFMAQLDFLTFAQANQSLILPEYKIAYGVNTAVNGAMNDFVTFKLVGGEYITTEDPALAGRDMRYIAPMQSFIVVPTSTAGSTDVLVADIEQHTETAPTPGATGNLLRSRQPLSDKALLHMTATRGRQTNTAVLVHWNQADKNFNPQEDSRKLFARNAEAAVAVYMLSSDGFALDINTTNDLSQIIPIGIRTAVKGNITLRFAGMQSFGTNTTILLHDSKTGQAVNLSQTDRYTFNKDEEELNVEGRFYLQFVDKTTGMPDNHAESRIAVFSPAPGTISIAAANGENLGAIQITDIQARRVITENHIQSPVYSCRVTAPGVYLVKVMGETNKVMVK
jgi:hypothetical protein